MIPPVLGRLAFMTALPLIRFFLRRTNRAYALIIAENEVLMVKGWLGRQKWQLPGGGIRRGEQPEQTIGRELREETGLSIKPDKLVFLTEGRWSTDRLSHHYKIYTYHLKSKQPLKILRPELINAAWLKPAELNDSTCPPEILRALASADLL